MLQKLIKSSPKEIDLTNDHHATLIIHMVNDLLNEGYSITEIEEVENQLINRRDPSLIFVLLALKLVKSKLLSSQITQPLFISVVFAVYKEHNRIKKSTEHEHGEDFLRKKIAQLEWLFNNQPLVQWELIIVDDGCPNGSGHIAQNIIEQENFQNLARVLFLSEAIEHQYSPVIGINSTKESQKGGSIIYGMWDAVQNNQSNNHIVIYTDADLSTHLGQVMLLIDPILNHNKITSIGSRREPKSVVIKKGTRNDRGKLFIYLWKRLIPNLGNIVDTQCGFKAFRTDIVPEIIDDMIETKFAFDIELLLKTILLNKGGIAKVPIAWIDSEEASTTTDLQPYLPMLKAISKMSKKYFSSEGRTNEFSEFLDALSEEEFYHILSNIPAGIVEREPDEFTEYDQILVKDFCLK